MSPHSGRVLNYSVEGTRHTWKRRITVLEACVVDRNSRLAFVLTVYFSHRAIMDTLDYSTMADGHVDLVTVENTLGQAVASVLWRGTAMF